MLSEQILHEWCGWLLFTSGKRNHVGKHENVILLNCPSAEWRWKKIERIREVKQWRFDILIKVTRWTPLFSFVLFFKYAENFQNHARAKIIFIMIFEFCFSYWLHNNLRNNMAVKTSSECNGLLELLSNANRVLVHSWIEFHQRNHTD